jgi:hypothetical protein
MVRHLGKAVDFVKRNADRIGAGYAQGATRKARVAQAYNAADRSFANQMAKVDPNDIHTIAGLNASEDILRQQYATKYLEQFNQKLDPTLGDRWRSFRGNPVEGIGMAAHTTQDFAGNALNATLSNPAAMVGLSFAPLAFAGNSYEPSPQSFSSPTQRFPSSSTAEMSYEQYVDYVARKVIENGYSG